LWGEKKKLLLGFFLGNMEDQNYTKKNCKRIGNQLLMCMVDKYDDCRFLQTRYQLCMKEANYLQRERLITALQLRNTHQCNKNE